MSKKKLKDHFSSAKSEYLSVIKIAYAFNTEDIVNRINNLRLVMLDVASKIKGVDLPSFSSTEAAHRIIGLKNTMEQLTTLLSNNNFQTHASAEGKKRVAKRLQVVFNTMQDEKIILESLLAFEERTCV